MVPDKNMIAALTLEEKYEWIEALIASIEKEEGDEPLPAWELDLLEKRLQAFRANPNQGRSWQEVLAELEAQRE